MATRTAALVRMTPPRPVAPIIRVVAPRAPAKAKVKHRRKSGGHSQKTRVFATAAAGLALGFFDKSAAAIPTIPILGRAGTVCAALYFFAPPTGMLADLMIASAAIAGYELGQKGSISGDIAPQVSVRGVANQV